MINEKKVSFIVCTNDETYAAECEKYIRRLDVPDGYEVDVLMVQEASSMTSGYNEGMAASDAKYKVYLHQDVMIFEKSFICRILDIFNDDPAIGLIGVVGNTKLPESAVRWDHGAAIVGGIYIDIISGADRRVYDEISGKYQDVVIIDGLLMATQYDIPWREDLFTGWHFYDLSQSMEFRRKGYRVIVPHMDNPWCFHDNDIHIIGDDYYRYRDVFLKEYGVDLEESSNKKNENRLKLYVVRSHVDRALEADPPTSVFEVPIQAGAALTDIRIADITDNDGGEPNISDRNRRYSEGTAMYWIYKHIDSDYVGILHYRRRLGLTDEDYISYMDQGVDLITTEPVVFNESVKNIYILSHYNSDWNLFMEILKKRDPENYSFAEKAFDLKLLYPCNMNVFKAEYYKEFCDWAFPILEEFYQKSPQKTDVYQHRDVGFIAERLSHLFVLMMKRDGKRVVEAPLVELKSTGSDDIKLDYSDYRQVFSACRSFFDNNQIKKCEDAIDMMVSVFSGEIDLDMLYLMQIIKTGKAEREKLELTLYEYLPYPLRKNLGVLLDTWKSFVDLIKLQVMDNGKNSLELFDEFISLTHFSDVAVEHAIDTVRMSE